MNSVNDYFAVHLADGIFLADSVRIHWFLSSNNCSKVRGATPTGLITDSFARYDRAYNDYSNCRQGMSGFSVLKDRRQGEKITREGKIHRKKAQRKRETGELRGLEPSDLWCVIQAIRQSFYHLGLPIVTHPTVSSSLCWRVPFGASHRRANWKGRSTCYRDAFCTGNSPTSSPGSAKSVRAIHGTCVAKTHPPVFGTPTPFL